MSTLAEKPTATGGLPIEGFNVLDPKVQGCPYPYYQTMRAQCPVYQSPQTGMFYVTKYDDIRFIKKHPELFTSDMTHSSRGKQQEAHAQHEKILSTYGWAHVQVLQRTDPPAHNRWRQYIDRTFTASRVNEMKPYVDQMVHELIDAFIDQGECEFVRDFCVPLPCKVIADQLGLPRDQYQRLKSWSDAMLMPGGLMATDDEIVQCAWVELDAQHFFYDVFEDRRKNPRNDIMSVLVNTRFDGEEPMSMHELQNMMHQLITGGNETTTSAISHALWNLLKNPEQMARLRADRSLVKNFVEETLRYETPILGLFRQATQDVELSDTTIPKGTIIFMAYGSANRDEDKFDDGETFDVTRKNAGAQIAFGMGAHFCPGAMLARREIQSAFEIMLDRMDDIQLARPLAEQTHEPSIFLHQLRELPITFRKR
ncbi:cytochrome P450 [Iodidimonas sp. SYSU 1G8]|uniref:cytochrome P450 n=1 Tax=Iodidimonas sp. SYSU 1G8 TaxID=3133967 RepID=UPI0031FF23D4